ncbi:site-specific DNA-methyltransferase [uncultured Megasphaera sp.]|uniref:site-specific DNA-methyltransferase n=1 Tax=uncultured Megasphaera sp. TaxID=165188 RepID=UPI0025996071|nr:site-specific DNA-methyltransferase [uncultured Megasphaera sp.]
MDKMRMESVDRTAQNIDKIGALFPNCITETVGEDGKPKKAINFELLKQMLSGDVLEGDEAYEFTWVGKKAAIVEANKPIRKTLRPCPEESVNWDTTENLYIEGDNLEVLKLMQESYLSAIKIIYIDPPYNTGSDSFVYPDNYMMDKDEYQEGIGLFDEDNNKLFLENNANNPRFHSDWDSMMYSRLMLARNLLSEDGIIFLSIGQGEIQSLIAICNEVFGESNCCGIISRVMKSGGAKGKFFSPNMEYILVYSKNILAAGNFREPISEEIINKLYTSVEESGERKGEKYRPFGLYQSSLDARPNQRYYIECPDGTFVIPPGETMPKDVKDGAMVIPKGTDGCWRWSRDRYLEEKEKGNIAFKESKGVLITSDGKPAKWNIYTKIWLSDRQEDGMVPVDLISKWENRMSTKELAELDIPFDFAKPTALIKYLIDIVDNNKDAIILDFFSGSATTAHATMLQNFSDGGNRKFIMVQYPEEYAEKSSAKKAGYTNICEIGKERIRRAGAKIKDDAPLTTLELDTGFRVLKVDDSNMTDIYYSPAEYSQDLLSTLESNVKSDRNDLDLLFGCLLEWGLPLSMPYTSEQMEGCTVHTYNEGDLIACFDENIPDSVIKEIAKRRPLRAVFRDSSFVNSPSKINVGEIFKLLAPDTRVKVI